MAKSKTKAIKAKVRLNPIKAKGKHIYWSLIKHSICTDVIQNFLFELCNGLSCSRHSMHCLYCYHHTGQALKRSHAANHFNRAVKEKNKTKHPTEHRLLVKNSPPPKKTTTKNPNTPQQQQKNSPPTTKHPMNVTLNRALSQKKKKKKKKNLKKNFCRFFSLQVPAKALTNINGLIVIIVAFRGVGTGRRPLLLGFLAAHRRLHEVPDSQQTGFPVLPGFGCVRGILGGVSAIWHCVVGGWINGRLVARVGVVVEGQHFDKFSQLLQFTLELHEPLNLSEGGCMGWKWEMSTLARKKTFVHSNKLYGNCPPWSDMHSQLWLKSNLCSCSYMLDCEYLPMHG